MFKGLFLKNGFEYDYWYEWVILAEESEKQHTKEEYKNNELIDTYE